MDDNRQLSPLAMYSVNSRTLKWHTYNRCLKPYVIIRQWNSVIDMSPRVMFKHTHCHEKSLFNFFFYGGKKPFAALY